MGTCIGGSGTPGGLGAPCMNNSDCSTNSCASDGNGDKYCVVACNPAMNSCPSSYSCISTGATSGVCWPDNGKGGGCATGGGDGALVVALGALGAMLVTRKRR
jgi:MYXO-CTERM domain-containing protein